MNLPLRERPAGLGERQQGSKQSSRCRIGRSLRWSLRCNAASSSQLVQLERICLADLSTNELEAQLQRHGIVVAFPPGALSAAAAQPVPQQPGRTPHHQQPQQPPHHQPRHQRQQQQQQQQQHLVAARAKRSKRVAAQAALRSMLLERLARARVEARARIVRLPLRLNIAGRAGSRRFLTLPVDIDGVGFVDFLLDGSAYLSRITPSLRDRLGFGPADGVAVLLSTGGSSGSGSSGSGSSSSSSSRSSRAGDKTHGGSGGSGGASAGSSGSSGTSSSTSGGGGGGGQVRARVRLRQRVQLPDMWLGTAKLPPQQAYVTPLQLPPRLQQLRPCGSASSRPQRVPASAGAVGGLLGLQVLREFEVDVDLGGNSVSLHPPGHVGLGLCVTRGMAAIPLRLTKTGALVVPVSLAGSPPFTGLLDLSATSSMLNWEAAALLGMTCDHDQQQQQQQPPHHQQPTLQSEQQDHGRDSSAAATDATAASPGVEQGGVGDTTPSRQQQQQQQPGPQVRQGGESGAARLFGTIDVVPSEQLLLKPLLPGPQQQQQQQEQQRGRLARPQRFVRRTSSNTSSNTSSKDSSKDSSSGGYSFTPLRGSSIVQQHRVAADEVKLVLGHVRLAAPAAAAAAAAATAAAAEAPAVAAPAPARLADSTTHHPSSSSSASSRDSQAAAAASAAAAAAVPPSSLAVPPPSRFGVATLRGLQQLGLAGRPVMVVGCDVWARQRAVVCLKAGVLYLSPS